MMLLRERGKHRLEGLLFTAIAFSVAALCLYDNNACVVPTVQTRKIPEAPLSLGTLRPMRLS